MLDADVHWLYIGIHAQMSRVGHFKTRHHTLVMAAIEKRTQNIVFETRYKADFGALAVRARNKRGSRIIGVNLKEEKILETTRFRSRIFSR